jgi:hypothetical protein
MKQLTTVILGNAMILLFLSCGSVDLAKKYPNMVANVDPFSIGTAKVQFDRPFSSKVNTVEIEAVFHPRLNAVSLEFKHNIYMNYRQFWDEAARKQFAASLELYKRDFEDRKLIDNYKKTRAVYGNIKGRVEWDAFKYAKTRVANPTIEIGYRYKESTPFFTTLMRSAKEVVSDTDSSPTVDSPQINMYFTRAQADEMVKLFDQARLLELLQEKTGAVNSEPEEDAAEEDSAPKDPYHEYGEQ